MSFMNFTLNLSENMVSLPVYCGRQTLGSFDHINVKVHKLYSYSNVIKLEEILDAFHWLPPTIFMGRVYNMITTKMCERII
jgi:hypothetical protein